MIPVGPATRIYLAAGVTDLRQSFEGLSDRVRHQFKEDPLSGHLFVFANRRKNRIKLLYWDGSGLGVCARSRPVNRSVSSSAAIRTAPGSAAVVLGQQKQPCSRRLAQTHKPLPSQ